jgi:hypothetical protein
VLWRALRSARNPLRQLAEGKFRNFRGCDFHFVGHHVPIDVRRRANVGMPHKVLLYGNRCSHGVEPTTVLQRHPGCHISSTLVPFVVSQSVSNVTLD